MAVTRPTKEGGATTYQGKVSLGFPDILASEMDADLDTIYAAWNGGVGTANLSNGSVTYAKLAPDAQLWRDTGTALTPGTSFATRNVTIPVGNNTLHSLVMGSGPVTGSVTADGTQTLLHANNGYAPLDATKSSWLFWISHSSDNVGFARRAPNAAPGTFTFPFQLDSGGNLTLPTTAVVKCAGYWVGTGARGLFNWNADATYLNQNSFYSPDDLTKPSWMLVLNGAGDSMSMARRAANAGAGVGVTVFQSFSDGSMQISGPTALKSAGTTWGNPSDPRLKDDVAPYARGLAEILALEPITYRLKADPDGPTCYGFDAAQVRAVFPECVSETRMKLDPDDEEETDGVLTFDMHPILVALVTAVKELAAR